MSAPNAPGPSTVSLLLAAHGERGGDAGNAGILRLAEAVAARSVVAKVGAGFIKGVPTIAAAVSALAGTDIIVYPVFASDGYFNRVRLPQLLDESGAGQRVSHVFAPLGLDSGLAPIIARRLAACVRAHELQAHQTDVILMAHGSRRDPASRLAATELAERLAGSMHFRSIGIAMLEEPPSLQEATGGLTGPILLVGLFCGDGMHGADDVKRQIAQCSLSDIVFAGNISEFEGIEELIACAITRWQNERIS